MQYLFPKPALCLRLVVFGHVFVGKTALVRRFVNNRWSTRRRRDVYDKTLKYDGCTFELKIVTAVPSEIPVENIIVEEIIQEASAIILAYSITCKLFYAPVESYWEMILVRLRRTMIPVVLVGLQSDNDLYREVDTITGQDFADEHGWPFLEASAKDNVNVTEVFTTLIDTYLRFTAFNNPKQSKSWRNYLGKQQSNEKALVDLINIPPPMRNHMIIKYWEIPENRKQFLNDLCKMAKTAKNPGTLVVSILYIIFPENLDQPLLTAQWDMIPLQLLCLCFSVWEWRGNRFVKQSSRLWKSYFSVFPEEATRYLDMIIEKCSRSLPPTYFLKQLFGTFEKSDSWFSLDYKNEVKDKILTSVTANPLLNGMPEDHFIFFLEVK